jgi:hypothetical protein
MVDQFHGDELELAAVHQLGSGRVADRAAKTEIIFEGAVLQASRAKDHHGLRFDHQPGTEKRCALYTESITEFESIGRNAGKRADAHTKAPHAGRSGLAPGQCFAGDLHQTLGDRQLVHLEKATMRP